VIHKIDDLPYMIVMAVCYYDSLKVVAITAQSLVISFWIIRPTTAIQKDLFS
jgi:hypothetical protein